MEKGPSPPMLFSEQATTVVITLLPRFEACSLSVNQAGVNCQTPTKAGKRLGRSRQNQNRLEKPPKQKKSKNNSRKPKTNKT